MLKIISINRVCLSLIILFPYKLSSQFIQSIDSKTIDSLEVLLTNSEDQTRIDLLNELAELYAWYNPEKAELFSNEALKSSIKSKYLIGQGLALYNKGYINYFWEEPVKAIDYFQQAISILELTNDYCSLGKVYERYAVTLFQNGSDKLKTFEYIPLIIKLYQAADNKKAESVVNLLASGGYFRINQPEKALDHLHRYWEISKEVGTSNLYYAISFAVAAACYIQLGDMEKNLEYNKKAIDQFDETVFEEISLKSQVEAIHGDFYLYAKKPDSAKKYFHSSLKHSKINGNAYNEMYAYYYMARLNGMKSNIEISMKYCDSAMHVAFFIDSTGSYYYQDSLKHCIAMSEDIFFPLSKSHRRYYAWGIIEFCYETMWNGYLKTNEINKAIQIQGPWMAIRDSIAKYNRKKNILEVNISYETEKNKQELARLSEDNINKEKQLKLSYLIVVGSIVLVLLTMLLAIILIRQNKLRNEQRTLLLQQRLFRLQMNPHFLYNSLASIQNFIIHQNPSEASSYLSKFSKLVRQILSSSATEYVSLEEELGSIQNYLTLQKIRYAEMFDYVIEVDDELKPETITIPPMLAQPFIENSIEHGFKHKVTKGLIHISIKQKQGYFILEIADNGVGRAKAKEIEKEERKDHQSMATTITTDRLAALNKKLKQKIKFEIIDLKDDSFRETGTVVIFEIPLNL